MKLTTQQTKTVDYTSIFQSKITFRISFRKFTLPYTFVVEDIIIYFAALAVIRQLFGQIIDFVGSIIMFGSFAISLALPYLVLQLVKRLPTDGKPIFYYLFDILRYGTSVLLPKKSFYKGYYFKPDKQSIVFKREYREADRFASLKGGDRYRRKETTEDQLSSQ